jgi:hypothetical protein
VGVVLSAAAAVSCGRVVLAACTAAAVAVVDVMDLCSLWFMVSLLLGEVSVVGVVLSAAAAVSCGRVALAACAFSSGWASQWCGHGAVSSSSSERWRGDKHTLQQQ